MADLTIRDMQQAAYANAKAHGFHDPDRALELILTAIDVPANDARGIRLADRAVIEAFLRKAAKRNVAEAIALIHSEASEALEAHRDGDMEIRFEFEPVAGGGRCLSYYPEDEAGNLGKPVGFASELADLLIRIGDTAESMGIDLTEAVRLKMAYNATRPIKHGKAY